MIRSAQQLFRLTWKPEQTMAFQFPYLHRVAGEMANNSVNGSLFSSCDLKRNCIIAKIETKLVQYKLSTSVAVVPLVFQ